MILYAINSYYHRMVKASGSYMPPYGISIENISFALILGEDGRLRAVEDLREQGGKKLYHRKMAVPAMVDRSSGIKSNFLWDKAAYLLGADGKGPSERNRKCFAAFKDLFQTVGDDLDDVGFLAVKKFLKNWDLDQVKETISIFQPWEEVCNANLVFRLDGTPGFIHDRLPIHQKWIEYKQHNSLALEKVQCLITGEKSVPQARIHTKIKGVRGGQTSGGCIVSFNKPAFVSYKHDKASVAETSAFAYTTALNYLLSKRSRQNICIADTTYVFWAKRSNMVEALFADMFNPPAESKDGDEDQDDQQTANLIRSLLTAIRDGRSPVDFLPELDENVQFYILGLAPNAARLSIRFWEADRLGILLKRVGTHYRQLSIVRKFERDPEFPPLWQLLKQTAPLGKTKNISPVLAGGLTRAIFTGAYYPQSLLPIVLNRIRAEHDVTYCRAALLKAYLMRNKQMKEVPVSLDFERTDLPYLLGRLFSVLEKAQEEAIPNANATVKDRYLASAAATPGRVFHILIKNSANHIAKLRKNPEKKRRAENFEKQIQAIMDGFSDYPNTLRPEEQGLFMIGYYHQRKYFFTKHIKEV